MHLEGEIGLKKYNKLIYHAKKRVKPSMIQILAEKLLFQEIFDPIYQGQRWEGGISLNSKEENCIRFWIQNLSREDATLTGNFLKYM